MIGNKRNERKCIASSDASLLKGDRGGSREHHLEPGVVLGTIETDFIGSFTMSPFRYTNILKFILLKA